MTDTPQVLLEHYLKQLKLPSVLREYAKLAGECARQGEDFQRFLLRLVEAEMLDRERRATERRIRAAKFPVVKSLETFDYLAIPSLNKKLVVELARCEWIGRRENVLALGNSGTGKTHIPLALGLAACQRGLRVRFTTAAALVHELLEARDEKRPVRFQKHLARQELLIVDELGFVPLSKAGAEVLFEVFSQRYERGSVLVTSNLPFAEWTEVLGSERLTKALLDRLTHHVHILEMNGESFRLKTSKQKRAAERGFVDVNPSAHLLYRLRRNSRIMSVHAAVSRGLARPKFDELSPFENVSSTKIVIGNPDLNPTRAWSYDADVEYATSRISFSVNAFRKTIRGVIEEVDTLENRGALDIYQVRNVGNGWLRGIEIEERLRMPSSMPNWVRAFSLWSNQTFISSRLLAANGFYRPFKEQPGWIANVGLDFNNDERSGTSVSIILNFTARRYDYKTSGDVTGKGGSSNIDMAVHQRVRGNWRLFAELNNLMNRDRSEEEMFVNGTVNRRAERYGRTSSSALPSGSEPLSGQLGRRPIRILAPHFAGRVWGEVSNTKRALYLPYPTLDMVDLDLHGLE